MGDAGWQRTAHWGDDPGRAVWRPISRDNKTEERYRRQRALEDEIRTEQEFNELDQRITERMFNELQQRIADDLGARIVDE
jgi:hypothetical protein